jgi:lysophospholipase L1-like esterase
LPGQLEQAVAALSQATQQGQPALALVWIGSNDLFYLYEFGNPDAAGEQADLDHYAANLDVILGALSKTGAQVMIALLDDQALRPVVLRGEAFPGISPEEATQMSAQVRRYNAVIVEKSMTYGALLVDFFNTGIFTGVETLSDDGNHPNAAGYDQIAQIWYAIIQSMF